MFKKVICFPKPWKSTEHSLNMIPLQTCDVSSLAPHTGSDEQAYVPFSPLRGCRVTPCHTQQGLPGTGQTTCYLHNSFLGRGERTREGDEGAGGWAMLGTAVLL